MPDVIKFPLSSRERIAEMMLNSLRSGEIRSFMGLTYDDKTGVHVYLPDEIELGDLLMARACIEEVVRELMQAQRG